jgi:hypothetical protein
MLSNIVFSRRRGPGHEPLTPGSAHDSAALLEDVAKEEELLVRGWGDCRKEKPTNGKGHAQQYWWGCATWPKAPSASTLPDSRSRTRTPGANPRGPPTTVRAPQACRSLLTKR